jgi:hypothetical protein
MQRNTVLKILNPVLGLLVLTQLTTGVTNGILPRHVFEILHTAGGFAVAAAVALHATLNWNWIRATYFKRAPKIAP